MKNSIALSQFLGFGITAFGGTILHFLYDWLGNSPWIAPFSGVNESTWEHMKLLFWPMLLFAVFQSIIYRDQKCFWCVKFKGVVLGISLIPILFYTYNGVIGKSPDWINILIFFISAAAVYIFETRRFKMKSEYCKNSIICLLALCIIGVLFVIFTFATPEIGIFQDPITLSYGI